MRPAAVAYLLRRKSSELLHRFGLLLRRSPLEQFDCVRPVHWRAATFENHEAERGPGGRRLTIRAVRSSIVNQGAIAALGEAGQLPQYGGEEKGVGFGPRGRDQ